MAGPYLTTPPRRRPFLGGCLTVTLVLAGFLVLLTAISRMDGNPLAKGDKVAVIPVKGMISDSEPVIEQLKNFGKDESVKEPRPARVVPLRTRGRAIVDTVFDEPGAAIVFFGMREP